MQDSRLQRIAQDFIDEITRDRLCIPYRLMQGRTEKAYFRVFKPLVRHAISMAGLTYDDSEAREISNTVYSKFKELT